ncbi:hypothetical protein C8Q75DRAFT_535690 [Abortiporus biennis]|nr:hypothetical protein C8Q75DRAFT_535690 [Abortiporus biennis]
MAGTENIQRHPEYYFPDGNFVIIAGNHAFRTHRTVLSRHSKVFRDMFTIPQPPVDSDLYDGCSVVHLTETREEAQIMFSVIYDGIEMYNPQSQSKILNMTMDFAFSILHLGMKYQIEPLQKLAIHRLERHFPTRLSIYQIYHQNARMAENLSGDGITLQTPEQCFAVANRARRHQMSKILPQLLYHCAQFDVRTILRHPELSQTDREIILELKEKIRTHVLDMMQPFFLRHTDKACASSTLCKERLEEIFEKQHFLWLSSSHLFCYVSTWLGVGTIYPANFGAKDVGLCGRCFNYLIGQNLLPKRDKLWKELGQLCDVPDWIGEV